MNGMYNFPSFLGQFSKQSKSVRLLSEISGHMSLHTSADKFEIRQTYIPTLTAKLMKPLLARGQDGIEETIQLLDDYYLTKDDFDSMTEIYLGKFGDIPTAVKSAFTRT